jgi:hypothetical protein
MDWSDRLLIAFAVLYLTVIAVGIAGADLHASADEVSGGDAWLLITSSLAVVPTLEIPQLILLAAAVGIVIWRHGPKLWWSCAAVGHIGAALVSYAVIGVAIWLGSESADATAARADYGISIILAATLGAMTAGALAAPKDERSRADQVVIALGIIGLVGMLAFSIGWYDMQHAIGYGIGFALAGWLIDRRVFAWTRPRRG